MHVHEHVHMRIHVYIEVYYVVQPFCFVHVYTDMCLQMQMP